MVDTMDLDYNDLRNLLDLYDKYIQDANDEDKYQSGWRPVCINEFIDCEFQEWLSELNR